MAYNDRAGIRIRVIEYLDGRTDLDSMINAWIDDTRRDVATKYNFSYLYTEATATVSAGVARYALPNDYLSHLRLFIGTKKLIRFDPSEFEAVHADKIDIGAGDAKTPYLYSTGSLEQSEPDYYIDRGLEFDLWPIPDNTYTLTLAYFAQPASFDDDTDYDYITTFHHEAVIFGAAWRGAIYLEDKDKESTYDAQYKDQVGMIVSREKERKTTDVTHRMRSVKDFSNQQLKRLMKINN